MTRFMKHISTSGTDAQSRCRRHLRTTAPGKDDVFGKRFGQRDYLKHPGANTVEENVAGIGTLGSFTF